MSDITNDVIELEDKARLNLTLTVRENIIKELTKDNTLPKNPDDRGFLLEALNGMDRTVLAKTKIKADDRNAKSQQENAKVIASILSKISLKNSPDQNSKPPELPADVIVDNPVPGEKDIGVHNLTYDTFMASNPPQVY